jgi:CheY-like chemotaxis protein
VLLVEDSPGDVRLTREAFRKFDKSVNLHVAVDGVDAMAFLKREGDYVNAPRPDFILLDLNLPKMDGREVLARIKGDPGLKLIPTIILTTSDAGWIFRKAICSRRIATSPSPSTGRIRKPCKKHHRFLADDGQIAASAAKLVS